MHSVYLVGNTANMDADSDYLRSLRTAISQEKDSFTLVFLGDLLDQNGMGHQDLSTKDSALLHSLMDIARLNPLGQTFFIPGDRDWDNSGKDGLEHRERIEDYIEDILGKGVFQPNNGCPGPEAKQVNQHLKIIFIDSQWWIHPHKKPTESDADCAIILPDDFWEEIQDLIETSSQENILIVGHHPMFSYGQYGGEKLWKKHLFPFTDINSKLYIPLPGLGTVYAAFRQNAGTPRDMAYETYEDFRENIADVLELHSPVIYASGHEYNTQLIEIEKNYYINSGTAHRTEPVAKGIGTKFKESEQGIVKLTYHSDGSVSMEVIGIDNGQPTVRKEMPLYQSACGGDSLNLPVNISYVPCMEQVEMAPKMNPGFYDSTTIAIGGVEYKSGHFKELWAGRHYRPSWVLPVRVRYLNLDTAFGGLKPFAKGGGSQTLSLKFYGKDGYEYVFRSVNKNPRKAIPYDLWKTIVEHLIQDQTTTQQPYGAMVVARMLDETEIFHAQPTLYLLPDDAKLGPFRKEFGNLFGMIEIRPKGPSDGKKGFHGADDVDRSFKFFQKVYEDSRVQLRADIFTKARIFDIWIGDWGKHQENWKWAGFKNGDKWDYYPVPRDRDHAFSQWDGVIPWLADREWAKQNVQDFGYRFQGIKSLTYQARHMDRFLLSEMDWPVFENAVKELQNEITEAIIDSAIAKLPVEDQALIGPTLAAKLKCRRTNLMSAAREYYLYLSKYVDVKGSNEKEIFEVERLPDGNVTVSIFRVEKEEKGERFFHRTFLRSETKEVRIFGLGKDDKIYLTGSADKSILVRVVGGPGEDLIVDSSSVKGMGRKTIVYDTSEKDTILSGSDTRHKTPTIPVYYDRQEFEYNSYLVIPRLTYNSDNGVGFGATAMWKIQRFHKPDFARKHALGGVVNTTGGFALDYEGAYRQVMGKWDLGLMAFYDGQSQQFPHFFGVGNETPKSDSLYDANYYRNRQHLIHVNPALQRRFWGKSMVAIGPVFEVSWVDTDRLQSRIFFQQPEVTNSIQGLGMQQFGGLLAEADIDLRDSRSFTRRGMQLYGRQSGYLNLNNSGGNYGRTEGFIALYHTVHIGLPVTLAVKGGGTKVYGDVPFYRLATVGQSANLRGFFRNRFAGYSNAYLNTELRIHFGKVPNPFLPFYYGIYGFYDMGRVWAGDDSKKLHHGVGAGFYLAPLSESLSFNFSFAHSKEEKILFQLGMGFFIQ